MSTQSILAYVHDFRLQTCSVSPFWASRVVSRPCWRWKMLKLWKPAVFSCQLRSLRQFSASPRYLDPDTSKAAALFVLNSGFRTKCSALLTTLSCLFAEVQKIFHALMLEYYFRGILRAQGLFGNLKRVSRGLRTNCLHIRLCRHPSMLQTTPEQDIANPMALET